MIIIDKLNNTKAVLISGESRGGCGGCGRIPLSSDKNFLNDYILGMYDCKCLTIPGYRQCTPVGLDVNNKSIFN